MIADRTSFTPDSRGLIISACALFQALAFGWKKTSSGTIRSPLKRGSDDQRLALMEITSREAVGQTKAAKQEQRGE
jgi:hypothetical protein